MGFGLGITLYAHPVMPGLPPERVITITGDHIDKRFQDTWDMFSPYFITEKNKMWMKMYNFGEIKESSYYDY